MEEANAHMFKGDLWMAQILRNGMFFLQGHDGEFTFMVKHGLLMGTSETPRIFYWTFDKTFNTLETDPPDTTVHDALRTLHSAEGIESGWIVEWLCGRSVHQR